MINRDRLGSFGVVLAAHVVFGCVLIYTMHAPIRQAPMADVAVTLVTPSKPPAEKPVPLAVVKHLAIPALDLPVPPAITEHLKAAVTPSTPVPAQKPILEEAHPEAPNEVATQAEDIGPSVDASATGNPKPSYPKISRSLGEQGRVLLDVYVQADGSVGEIRLHQSCGYDRLDDSALRAVRQWHFKPARQAGKQIAMWYVQPITFNLQSA